MRYLKIFGLVALGLTMLAAIAATASAEETTLPSLLFLPSIAEGEFKSSSSIAQWKFTGIQNLVGKGDLFELFGKDMAELGVAKILYNNALLGAKECSTEGDAAGTILIDNAEWHLALGLGTEPFLILILLPSGGVHLECNGTLIILTGSMAWQALPFGVGTTSFTAATGVCTGSTPAFSEYDNMTGGMSKVELKSETGGIKAKSCWEISKGEENIAFTASNFVEVMEP